MRWYRGESAIYAKVINPYARRGDLDEVVVWVNSDGRETRDRLVHISDPVPPEMKDWQVPCWNFRRADKPGTNTPTAVRLTKSQKERIAVLSMTPLYDYIPGLGVRTKTLYKLERTK